jgi:membrane protease subunit HflK
MSTPETNSPLLRALRSSISLLRWLLVVLLLVYLFSNVRIIGPNESGLVMRFGRLTERVHQPGLLLALPSPIDEVFVLPTKTVAEIELDEWTAGIAGPEPVDEGADEPMIMFDALESGEAMAADTLTLHPARDGYGLTGDVNLIHARFSVRYSITDPRSYVLNARDPEEVLRPILLQAAGIAARKMEVDDILTSGRDRFRLDCEQLAQQQIDQLGLGITLRAWETREIVPASQVLDAFEEVTSARVEAQTMLERADTYRESTMPQARADAYRTVQEATAEASSMLAEAEGKAAAFLAMLEAANQSPHAFRSQQFNETLEKVLEKTRVPAIDATRRKGIRIMMGGIQ